MKKILITGGSGFIGKNLIPELNDYELFVLCKEIPKYRCSNVEYLICDLLDLDSLKRIKSIIACCDIVIDLASLSSKNVDINNFENNVLMKTNLINILDHQKKIIYISTIDVYGNSFGQYDENDLPHPTSYYGVSKLICEQILETYCLNNNVDLIVLRLSQVYGHNQANTNTVVNFIKVIDEGGNIQLFNEGIDKRKYIYIDDVIKIIKSMIEMKATGIFNVAGDEIVSIYDLIKTIEKLLNKKAHIIPSDVSTDGDKIMKTNKIKAMLDFDCIQLENGLKTIINKIRKNQYGFN